MTTLCVELVISGVHSLLLYTATGPPIHSCLVFTHGLNNFPNTTGEVLYLNLMNVGSKWIAMHWLLSPCLCSVSSISSLLLNPQWLMGHRKTYYNQILQDP